MECQEKCQPMHFERFDEGSNFEGRKHGFLGMTGQSEIEYRKLKCQADRDVGDESDQRLGLARNMPGDDPNISMRAASSSQNLLLIQ